MQRELVRDAVSRARTVILNSGHADEHEELLKTLALVETAAAPLPRAKLLVDESEDGDGYYLECPNPTCGVASDFEYLEDIINSRTVNAVEDDGKTLPINGYYETDGGDDGENGRLCCRSCGECCAIPEGIEIDWV